MATLTFGATSEEEKPAVAVIQYSEFKSLPDHAYQYSYQLDNGQYKSESGTFHKVGDQTVLRVEGRYSYIGDDEVMYEVRYTSDENGFRASGDHLPDTKTFVEVVTQSPQSPVFPPPPTKSEQPPTKPAVPHPKPAVPAPKPAAPAPKPRKCISLNAILSLAGGGKPGDKLTMRKC